ncbi:hypothetical protein CHELA1G2_12592 [Hyphomicrobiales bacterium]|nr:hypothetical protein CHELA1G2_12592 [Hyphomicrobiales bacterium]
MVGLDGDCPVIPLRNAQVRRISWVPWGSAGLEAVFCGLLECRFRPATILRSGVSMAGPSATKKGADGALFCDRVRRGDAVNTPKDQQSIRKARSLGMPLGASIT